MAVVRVYEDDDYRPDYSLLVIVDPNGGWPEEDPVVPRYRDRGDMPAGSFAASGAGWITCQASGEADHEVRLELHDARPPDDRALFDDVLETPYRSSSGGLTLTTLTGGAGAPVFHLGEPEWFRVRIARRRDDTEEFPLDRWLLRFWPEPGLEPPIWLARHSRPSTHDLAQDVEAVLRWRPGPPLEITAKELAGRLLIDEATLSDVLVAAEKAELFHADENGETLRLTPGRRPGSDQSARSSPPASTPSSSSSPNEKRTPDAVPATAGPAVGRRPTPAELMAALQAVLAAEGHPAMASGLAQGSPPTAEQMLAALKAAEDAVGHEHPTDADLATGAEFGVLFTSSRPQPPEPPPEPPFGSPPRAGIIETDGTVVVWRDGTRAELANIGRVEQVQGWETALGVLVARWGQPARLVAPDGAVTEFDEPVTRLRVLGDGRRVALLDSHHHRRKSRYLLRILDLADGSLESMPWPEDQEINLLGVHRDTIYFKYHPRPGDPGMAMRWTPGSDPQPHGCPVMHVDPVSGATCAPTADGTRIDYPDGTTVPVLLDPWSRVWLAPGGERLCQRPDPGPPEFRLLPIDGPARVWKLPAAQYASGSPHWLDPIWEDADNVLIGHGRGHQPNEPSSGIRIHTTTGTMVRLPPTAPRTRLAALITPLLTR
ncbi:hypothetical protein BJY16_007058 [Actinoplanes octamycinicus]|uniref:Uncharacterized protein n=1 Tax=Actinoplanes octamycinicus TaxID=135948 RepID=A0A7W7MAZ8_9ACTN|nr:hypothetical protein [Actinoplanes octamycinicus]MBB4743599.1 hypothetical protein [Actinoplanes octamycinicus]